LNVADASRVAVMGASMGGYATLGLVALTNRFKAAIAISGLVDLVSLYGTFEVPDEQAPHERLDREAGLESGWGRMGTPPWKDVTRYIRNSPLFYVERMNTPVLLIQGDTDSAVPIQQGEELFSALYRQGKRARFVRYFGEGHVVVSPPNIRDQWKQIYAWLD